MLLLDAEIYLYEPKENPEARYNDIDATGIYRPAINFGDIYLSSGTFIFDKNQRKAFRGKNYRVIIELPLIFADEVFEMIKPVVVKNGSFKIQEGAKVVGKGKILDYFYESDANYF